MSGVEDRFWARVDKSGECWLWTGASTGRDLRYGSFTLNGRQHIAHRVSYELSKGRIPEGLVIDHLCHVYKCVRPDHLQAVTQKQNLENLAGAKRTSKSGVRGVSWHRNKWRVCVQHDRHSYHGGVFADIKDAEAAAIALRNNLFSNNLQDRSAV